MSFLWAAIKTRSRSIPLLKRWLMAWRRWIPDFPL
nr:MAG TPA: hypothetical protein [Caudoviricetes sp.]